MVKTIATYRDRLTTVLQVCIEVQVEKGFIRVRDVAERLGITERATRDYLNDLEGLGFLKYEGSGLYKLVRDSISELAEMIKESPIFTLSVDEFIPLTTLDMAKRTGIERKISKIFERLGFHISKAREIRESLLKSSPSELGVSDVIKGDRIIHDKSYYALLYLHNISIGGETSEYLLSNYLLKNLFPLSISYIAACAVYSSYEWNMLAKSQIFLRPRIEQYAEREPYEENELFYELSTEYPELLIFGRKIASRLLKEIQRYSACADLLENTDAKILFTKGSLIPHGFILARDCKRLAHLHDKVTRAFKALLQRASKNDTLIVGVSTSPRDMRFFKAIEDKLDLKGARTNDYVFLKMVLEDGDVTAPILVEKERGKEIKNYYEFYANIKGEVIKFEFITNEDPVETQKAILPIISSLITPSPFKKEKEPYGLNVIFEAKMKCRTYIQWIKRQVESAINYACIRLIDQMKGQVGQP
ncbi:MAG: hypothetical protein J7L11_05140 [Thermoprotei archaeon]|nr:hypothetical protein [Thermoprotei archaeon]